MRKPAAKSGIRLPQSLCRIHFQKTRHIDKSEKQIANLMFHLGRVLSFTRSGQLRDFFPQFLDDSVDGWPFESYASSLVTDLFGLDQGRKVARHAVENRIGGSVPLFALLLQFDFVPTPFHVLGCFRACVAEDMRVPPD